MSNDEFLSIGAKAAPLSNTGPSSMSTSDLQFQKAEQTSASASSCQVCGAAITQEYFRARGQVVCSRCANQIRISKQAPTLKSMPLAIGFGIGAAIAGSALYSIVTIVHRVSTRTGRYCGRRHGGKSHSPRFKRIRRTSAADPCGNPDVFCDNRELRDDGIYEFVRNPEAATETSADNATVPAPASEPAAATTEPDSTGKSIAVGLVALGLLLVAAPFLTLGSGFPPEFFRSSFCLSS
jgi:hypothetical protein